MTLNSFLRPRLSLRWLLLLVAAIALALGLLSERIRRQQEIVRRFREMGGQMESPTSSSLDWITGITIDSVQFLGPKIGDENVPSIIEVAKPLEVKRITFMETGITIAGMNQLRSGLPDVDIRSVTPLPGMREPATRNRVR